MSSVHSEWTQHENKLFEMALADVDPNSPDRFEKIASKVPGKTVEQVQIHYQMLVDDIEMIESDEFPIPNYIEIIDDDDDEDMIPTSKKRAISKKEPAHPMSTRGIPWTDEEHRMFLIGLKNCGKGDWRSISRNYVRSRTPTQVASHAQKHYLRISSSSNTNSSAGGTIGAGAGAGRSTTATTTRGRHPRPSIHDIRNKQADDHHQAPMPLIKNNVWPAAKNNNFMPIAPAPYPSTEAFSSSSFSSTSSTARTTATPLPTSRRTTTMSNLIPNSNFNNGPSRLSRSPQILNNIGNYGSSSYSPSTFMMSSAPQAVPQQQYRPLQGQYPMTAAGAGGAFYGGSSSTAGYSYYYNNNNNNNNNSGGTDGTRMLMNNQQTPQIQSSSSYGYNTGSSYGYNTGLWGDDRSSTGPGSGGVVFHLGPTVAEPPSSAAPNRSSIGSGSGNGGVVFQIGPTVADPPPRTTYRSSTGTGSGGVVFELGPTVAEPPPATAYRSSTGTGSGSGGVVFELGPTVAEPAAPAPAPNIWMDVDDNNTNITNHPYNYDQPIYSPAYDPDMYPGYM